MTEPPPPPPAPDAAGKPIAARRSGPSSNSPAIAAAAPARADRGSAGGPPAPPPIGNIGKPKLVVASGPPPTPPPIGEMGKPRPPLPRVEPGQPTLPPAPAAPSGPPPPPVQKKKVSVAKKRVQWEKELERVRVSDSRCVFFVDLKERTSVVVKGSSTVVSDVFGNRLAELMGISTPACYIQPFTYMREFRALQRAVEEGAEPEFRPRVRKELNRPFLLVMDQLSGVKDMYTVSPAANNGSTMWVDLVLSHSTLFEIGRVLAVDMVLNNWDRLPLIWNNDGNGANIMFSRKAGKLVVHAIDQAITAIRPDMPKYEIYFNKISHVIEEVIAVSRGEHTGESVFDSLCEFFHMWTGVAMTEQFIMSLREGVVAGMIDCVERCTPEAVQAIYDDMNQWCRHDWENVWTNGMKRVDLEFVNKVVGMFAEHIDTLKEARTNLSEQRLWLTYGLGTSLPVQHGGHCSSHLKVMSLQIPGGYAQDQAEQIRQFLQGERDRNVLPTDVIVCWEGWLTEALRTSKAQMEHLDAVKYFMEVSSQFNCYILMGTGMEMSEQGLTYCTSVLVGPDGYVGSYRKRRPNGLAEGDRVGCWDTPIGRLAIMICFDIEVSVLFEETVALKPDIILNPIQIACTQRDKWVAWNLGLDQMSLKFERLCREGGYTIIRTDSPYGLGSSQIISPYHSVACARPGPCATAALIEKVRPGEQDDRPSWRSPSAVEGRYTFEALNTPLETQRSAWRDNTGRRYLGRVLSIPHAEAIKWYCRPHVVEGRARSIVCGDGAAVVTLCDNSLCVFQTRNAQREHYKRYDTVQDIVDLGGGYYGAAEGNAFVVRHVDEKSRVFDSVQCGDAMIHSMCSLRAGTTVAQLGSSAVCVIRGDPAGDVKSHPLATVKVSTCSDIFRASDTHAVVACTDGAMALVDVGTEQISAIEVKPCCEHHDGRSVVVGVCPLSDTRCLAVRANGTIVDVDFQSCTAHNASARLDEVASASGLSTDEPSPLFVCGLHDQSVSLIDSRSLVECDGTDPTRVQPVHVFGIHRGPLAHVSCSKHVIASIDCTAEAVAWLHRRNLNALEWVKALQ